MSITPFRIQRKTLLVLLLITIVIAGCSGGTIDYVYQAPTQLEDGLTVGTIDEVGMDVNTLGKAIDRIRDGKWGAVHSLLIYKDGKLVFEEYFPGHHFSWEHEGYRGEWTEWGPEYDDNSWHVNTSVSKSFVSAIVSIAIQEGFINNVNDSIFDYLPDYQQLATGGKENITIEHLVTMSSGLQWDEWGPSHADTANDSTRMYYCEDQIQCILEMPLIEEPGTKFNYNGGSQIVLGEIVRYATGMMMDEFAGKYLYDPLGIDREPTWVDFESGVIDGAGGALHTSREMMKLGVTYLNGGVWDGQQVIPEEWVYLSSVPFGNNTSIKVPGADGGRKGYTYSWWTWSTKHNSEPLDTYYAGGWGGQRIFVIQGLDMVVVMTGGNYTSKTYTFTIMEDYVLAAIK